MMSLRSVGSRRGSQLVGRRTALVSPAAISAIGLHLFHSDAAEHGVPAPDKEQKLYRQDKTGGGAYADRDDPKAQGVQPTEKKTDEEITQKDTAAKGVSPKECGNAEGGKPIDSDQKSQETVLGVQPSGTD